MEVEMSQSRKSPHPNHKLVLCNDVKLITVAEIENTANCER